MQFILGVIVSFFVGILKWLAKKLTISKGVFALQIAVAGAYYVFLFSAVTFIVNFLFEIWDLVHQVMDQLNNMSVSGSAYGISLETILLNAWGFMQSAGITEALSISFDLFMGLLSAYFTVKAYQLFIMLSREIYVIITDSLKLLTQ
ncbi:MULTISPECIES: hypothetical protein [unclassified Nitratiruptor]|uniref:hypothetical protein n=1 Tax=unclassified Nitratiruptor TaxID=2624044 RepID=UPI001914E51F|nr:MULTISPECIES: hypothetical protein [unclassified Nitratiruptor]BCD60037.1 hypothetical protein NitYY0810_C0800 [Nitratiruptor sp. YY08-10]